MSGKHISIFNNDRISLTQGNDGFWLYDKILAMNISMKAKTEQAAFIDALTYYQKSLKEANTNYKTLYNKVDSFVGSLGLELDD